MQPLVSIIVPIFNTEEFLSCCLDSLVSQTYQNIEIILVNDGSTDSSEKIIQTYAQKDHRISIISQNNGGAGKARNEGLRKAAGEYITFVDSDDKIESTYIEKLIDPLIKDCDIDISICNYFQSGSIVNFEKETNDTYDSKDYLEKKMKTSDFSVIVPWGKLFRKKVTRNIFFPENIYFEDEATVYKFFYFSKKITYNNTPLYYYNLRNGSLTQAVISKHPQDAVSVFEKKYIFFKERNEFRFFPYIIATLLWQQLNLYRLEPNQRATLTSKIKTNLIDFCKYSRNYEHYWALRIFSTFPFFYIIFKKFTSISLKC